MKFTKIISLLLVAVLGIGALASCASVDDGNTAALDKEALTYVSLRINPEIELLADEDGNVVSTGKNDYHGNISFGKLVFDKAGTYNFKMKEVTCQGNGNVIPIITRNWILSTTKEPGSQS